MKKKHLFWAIPLVIVVVLLVSSKIILAQPHAKKICFYPKADPSQNIKLEELRSGQSVCFDSPECLNAFNSAKTSLYKFYMWKGGFYGTFTDKNDKEHLLKVSYSDGYVIDVTSNKVYNIEEGQMRKKWGDMIDTALSKIPTLE